MQFPIVREYQTDILQKNRENKIEDEPHHIPAATPSRIFAVDHGPFFTKDLKLKAPNGEPLIYKKHYRIFRQMSRLTKLAGQKVAGLIELLDPAIEDFTVTYHSMGEMSLVDNDLLDLIEAAVNDDRPVWWDNISNKRPYWNPTLHTHSLLYEIMAFQDFVEVLELILVKLNENARSLIEVRIDHYLNLIRNYVAVHRESLGNMLLRHQAAYNEHGLTAAQIGMQNVDNFATARGSNVLQGRADMHLTVAGLRTIIENYGFNSDEFLKINTLPISAYGNNNFIPPSIDGSFEGLGGTSETAGICTEYDGTVVYLANRMDGRVRGLYFSTLSNPYSHSGKLTYTSYKYTHQRFEQDGTSVDRIAQGSGDEVILVGNNHTGNYYIGLTNGTLDPTKTVYSRLNMDAIINLVNPNDRALALDALENAMFSRINVALMGEWIYVFFAHGYKTPGVWEDPSISDNRYRHIYRVRASDVAAQLDVTLVQQNVTFDDIKGVQHNNAPFWRWANIVGSAASGYNSYIYDFNVPPVSIVGCYRSQQTFSCEHRDKPGKYLVRFMTYFWSRYNNPTGIVGVEGTIEILYEFDPSTNTFVKLKSSPVPSINWADTSNFPPYAMPGLTSVADQQGANVMDDGAIIASGGRYQSYPRLAVVYKPLLSRTRFETMMMGWLENTQWQWQGSYLEGIVSPLKSSVKPRSFLFAPGGEFYTAATNENSDLNGLFFRTVAGKLAVREDVTNLLLPNVVARPLSNNVKKVNAIPHMGGISVTVPSAQLDTFGIEVGDSAFAMGVQYRFLNYSGNYWPAVTNLDDIRVFPSHNVISESDGTLSIQPTETILYPASIVEQLKAQVQYPALMAQSNGVPVVVADPSGRLVNKFGWLPTLVMVQYSPTGTPDFYATLMSIVPTYSVVGNVRTVTGFTVLDKINLFSPNSSPTSLASPGWSPAMGGASPDTSHGSMRCGIHVNGNDLQIVFDSGVVFSGPGDGIRLNGFLRYPNKTTQRWSTNQLESYVSLGGNSGFTHWTVVPDDGPVAAHPYAVSTGGAATIFRGLTTGKNYLLGSVYPETGWVIFFQTEIAATFNGKRYTLPLGNIDLRDIDASPYNKTFYIYALLENGEARYEISLEKRVETPFLVWVGTAVTNERQIITVERFNVFTINGHRVSELKRGNSIPASSGLVGSEGQIPWIRPSELLP